MTFNGFISYSHAADGRLAPAIQHGLHRLAKPWHRRRALWIFRDQTGLSVTPALWSSIQEALDGSDYFVLLASPEAARSPWVNREIEHWMATKSADRILPVVTDGEWAWDRTSQDFMAASTAVPAALRGVFAEEPLFLDLRWARGDEQLSLHHTRFRDAIAQLAAPMHGVSKDDLEGEDVRQHRRVRRLQWGAVATLLILTMLASVTGALAVQNAVRANASAQEARRQQLAADEQRGNAASYAKEAQEQQALAVTQQARAAAAVDEARRQQALADRAKADAALQSREAARQQANALRQQKLADQATRQTKEQQQLATKSAAQAAAASAEAQRMTRAAQEQQQRARAASAEAARQQANAEKQQRVAISSRLLGQAKTAVGSDPATALKLGTAAQSIQPDASTKNEFAGIVTSTHFAGTINDVSAIASAPDGVLVSMNSDATISLWNVADRTRPIRLSTLADSGQADGPLALSPDGRTVAFTNSQYRVVLWDLTDRSHPVRIGELKGQSSAYSIAFSPDGRAIVVGFDNGDTSWWDITNRARPTLTGTLKTSGSTPADRIAFSPDRRTLAELQLGNANFWDVTDPARPVAIDAAMPQAHSAAFSPSDPIVATGQDGVVTLWDMAALNPAADPPGQPLDAESGEPSPADPAPQPATTRVYASHQLSQLGGLTGTVNFVNYSADGRRIVAADDNGNVLIWDSTNAVYPRPISSVPALGPIHSATFSPDDRTLITVDGSATATLWNVESTASPKLVATLMNPFENMAVSAFTPDGRTLAVVSQSGAAEFWTMTDSIHPAWLAEVPPSGGAISSAAFSPDLHTLATMGLKNGRVALTDVTNPTKPIPLTVIDGEPGLNNVVLLSPDGRTLATVAANGVFTLWDLADRGHPRLLSRTVYGSQFGTGAAFSPDGRTLTIASGPRGLTLFNVADPSRPVAVSTVVGHGDTVQAVAVSRDGHLMASASRDHTTVLWDLTDPTGPHRLATLSGDGNPVSTVAFSRDGRTLATANNGGLLTAVVWDIADRSAPIRLAKFANRGWTTPVSFGPSGHALVTAGTVWDYQELDGIRSDPAKYACAITGRGLTPDEWSSFVPELPYQHTC
ncbi:MAG: hypothetical protein QOC94_1439 [Actinoplanes sp.]|nr:hypothetical protein [Actinoplanes sp.]